MFTSNRVSICKRLRKTCTLLVTALLCVPQVIAEETPHDVPQMTSILQTLELPTDFQQTAALYQLLARSGVEDVKRFIKETESVANPMDRAVGLNIIYARFADLDPNAAVDHLLSEVRTGGVDILFTIFSSWAKVDLNAAVAKSRELQVQSHRQTAEQAILMAQASQGAAVEQLAGRMNSNAGTQFNMLSAVQLLLLAQSDPEAAMQQALQIPDWDMQIRIVAKISTMWADQDHKEAMRYSKSLTAERVRDGFQGTLLHHLVVTQPETAIEYLYDDQFTDEAHGRFLNRIFTSLAESDPERAYHFATGQRTQAYRERATSVVLASLTGRKPTVAFELLQLVTDPAIIRKHASAVLEQFAVINPTQALEWAERQTAHRQEYLNAVISVIARSDPEQALSVVSELPDSQSRTRALAPVIKQIANQDPTLAIQFLDLLGNSAVRYQTTNEIAMIWMTHEPVAAFVWIKNLPARQQVSLLSTIASAVALENVELAQALLPELTNSVVRENWVSAIARQLANGDPTAAVAWLGQFRGDPIYLQVVAGLVTQVARTDVAAALAIAEEIRDETNYTNALQDVLGQWAVQDAPAAAAWASDYGQLRENPHAAARIARHWAEFDIEAALRWVTQLEWPNVRDQALAAMIENSYVTQAQAQRMLGAITERTMLDRAAARYVNDLARYDAAEARRQLRSLGLPVDIEKKIEGMLEEYE